MIHPNLDSHGRPTLHSGLDWTGQALYAFNDGSLRRAREELLPFQAHLVNSIISCWPLQGPEAVATDSRAGIKLNALLRFWMRWNLD
jgi:hypothetical protein